MFMKGRRIHRVRFATASDDCSWATIDSELLMGCLQWDDRLAGRLPQTVNMNV
jgi:hypothetical protein